MADQQTEVRHDHVMRAPLPWRPDEQVTECGRYANTVETVITAEQYAWRVKNWGSQRTAFTVCITCADCARYTPRWESDPVAVISRESRRTGSQLRADNYADNRTRLTHELHAMVDLALAHPDEFAVQIQAHIDAAAFEARRVRKEAERRGNRQR